MRATWCNVCSTRGQTKGFTVEYLARVPEVKDTVQKHSLLQHLCNLVIEQFPDSADLFSEIGSVCRSAKVSVKL